MLSSRLKIALISQSLLWRSSWINGDNTTYPSPIFTWLLVNQNLGTGANEEFLRCTTTLFNVQNHSDSCRILGAWSTQSMRPDSTLDVNGGGLKDPWQSVEHAAAYSATEETGKGTVLLAIDWEPGYKRNRSDPVPKFVVCHGQVMLSIKCNREEEAVTCMMLTSFFAAVRPEVFRSYVKCRGLAPSLSADCVSQHHRKLPWKNRC